MEIRLPAINRLLKQLYFLLLLFVTYSAAASGIAQFKGVDGGEAYTLSLEYLDRNTSRIDMDNQGDVESYLLFKEKQAQVITGYQGNTLIMDLANLSTMAQNLGVLSVLGIDSEKLKINIISMQATGRKEKVAGIEGDIYKLIWTRNNVRQQDELVLSSSKQAWEYTEAWTSAVDAITNSSPSISIDGGALLDTISNEKLGILRLGNRFRLVSVLNIPPNPARFNTPDTSFTIPDLGGLLGNL